MSDLQLLFLVLAVVYAWECAFWTSIGTVAFRSWFGSRWQVVSPGSLLGNQWGGLIFSNPLPPLGTFLAASHFPLTLSPDGVLNRLTGLPQRTGQSRAEARAIRWKDIGALEIRGKNILVQKELLAKMPSSILAEQVGEILRKVVTANPVERGHLIEQILRARFEIARIKQDWQEFKKNNSKVRIVTNGLFIYLFVLAPAVIWYVGLVRSWPILLVCLLALTASVAVLFNQLHKKLYLKAEDERFTHSVVVLLSPATAIRASDVLSRWLLQQYDPLAVAKVFCSAARFETFARAYWRELYYPTVPSARSENALAQEIEIYGRTAFKKAVEDFLKKHGVDLESLIQPPQRTDESCLSFCPRCLAQFTIGQGICADCGGLTLIPF